MADKNNSGNNEYKRPSLRAVIFMVVGIYELFVTARIVIATVRGDSGLDNTTAIVLTILMAVLGIGILIFAWKVYKKDCEAMEDEDTDPVGIPDRSGNRGGTETPENTEPDEEKDQEM